jgi:hypothetical protein
LASRTGATRPPEDFFAELEETFVRNHAQSILACDFLVVVTARFRTLYVFLLMEVGTRRIMHCNVTAHPTIDIPSPKTAGSRLARFSAASITNTAGKGSPREGREELRGHCALIAL